jgi:hypothetical protein
LATMVTIIPREASNDKAQPPQPESQGPLVQDATSINWSAIGGRKRNPVGGTGKRA